MPDISNWTTTTSRQSSRAIDAWNRIQEKPSSIIVRRNGVDQAAQTVRVEYDSTVVKPAGSSIDAAQGRIVVFGVRGHPTVADTNIQRADEFWLDDPEASHYVVDSVIGQTGEVQAIGRRLT